MVYSKKGFTLFELMIVLALIGIFFGITMSMNKDARTYQLGAERLANAIYEYECKRVGHKADCWPGHEEDCIRYWCEVLELGTEAWFDVAHREKKIK